MGNAGDSRVNVVVLIDALLDTDPVRSKIKFFAAIGKKAEKLSEERDIFERAIEAFERDLLTAIRIGDREISLVTEQAVMIALLLKERKRKQGNPGSTWHQRFLNSVIAGKARRRRDELSNDGHRANLHAGILSAEEIAAEEVAAELRKRGHKIAPSTIAKWIRSGHSK